VRVCFGISGLQIVEFDHNREKNCGENIMIKPQSGDHSSNLVMFRIFLFTKYYFGQLPL
jgi:hypothetical protein